jgi:hypothetical protein
MPQPELTALGEDCPAGGPPSDAGFAAEQCRSWLWWAAAQLDTSLASDAAACNHLLASLNDLMERAQTGSEAGVSPADDAIGRKMAAVIVAVQGHDRVMQGLTHEAQSLRAVHRQLGDARCADSTEAWRLLRDQQMRSFSMADERTLFARMVAGDSCHDARTHPDDTVELFAAAHDSADP